MATLVLAAVGTAIGGPIGGAIGAIFGQSVDSRVFAPKARHGPRLGDLSVQTSSYGTQIPKIFGRMRVAGTVIWATDIKEDRTKSSGGKGQPKTVTYSYSASFAVVLSGRPIRAVRRMWADGKLLRGAAGDFKSRTKYRLYLGSESQMVDPIIASMEGMGNAPAHRGTAYAVFEDFELADYGNRIPSITFELEAEEGPVTIGAVAAELSEGDILDGITPAVGGYAASGDSVRGAVEALSEVVPLSLCETEEGMVLTTAADAPLLLPTEAINAVGNGAGGRTEISRRAAGAIPAEVSVSYYDPDRDYQTGLQRAGRAGASLRAERLSVPAALIADAAKAFAERRLAYLWAARETGKLNLGWRHSDLRAGQYVRLSGRTGTWRVSRWSLDRMVVELEIARIPGAAAPAEPFAHPGRPTPQPDLLHGGTKLLLLDLPPTGDEVLSAPRIVAAAAGAEQGWRQAALTASLDGGTWQPQGSTAAPATMGVSLTVLGPSGSALIDRAGTVEVELLNESMWLEGRSDPALAMGENAAMLGDELIQFGEAEPLGNRRFRLKRLLRGRQGTEWAAALHHAGEPFVLLEQERLAPLEGKVAAVGGELRMMASSIGDSDPPPLASLRIEGRALQPPSPVQLRAVRETNGDVGISWTRRSRSGWSWPSGADTPLGEEVECYELLLSGNGSDRRMVLSQPGYVYTSSQQAVDSQTGPLLIRVSQLGTHARSRVASISIN
ncbi:MAG TPA: phage tail protein [Allosphingosinicella sp.]|jgi:hypothetical protein